MAKVKVSQLERILETRRDILDTTNIKAEFVIVGDNLEPDKVTNLLGVKPTQYWIKNEVIEGKSIRRKDSCWIIGTEYEASLDVNEQISKLMLILRNKTEILYDLKLKNGFEYLFVFIINVENNQSPTISFERGFLDFVHTIEAEFYVDLYVMS